MSAPPCSSGAELSSLQLAGKSKQGNPKKIWKLFIGYRAYGMLLSARINHIHRKFKADGSHPTNPPSKNTTACDNIPVKKHRSTPNLKGVKDMNAKSRYPPYQEFPPPSPSAEYFVRTSSNRPLTDHPTIFLVIDDNWDSSSIDFPFKRVDQMVPMDITDKESSESSSHLDTHSRCAPQLHPIKDQRRRDESGGKRWFKKYMLDPNASFLTMDETTQTWI